MCVCVCVCVYVFYKMFMVLTSSLDELMEDQM